MKIDTDRVSAKSSFIEEFAKSEFDFTSEASKFAAMLRTGVKLAQEGSRAEARHLLLRVAEAEPQNETAWLWLASISEYPEELLIFLQNVLKINPQNERAIEWEKATKSLLAKTFVQRGIEACQESRADFGKQCFLHALGQDQNSEMAWLWLASVTEEIEEKIIHLQKVLSLNPDNETAQSSLKSLKDQKIQSLLRKANSAAIAGEHETAHILLEDVMNESPDVEQAWILKAYLAADFFEKIKCYEQVLQINPANEAAQAGISSLKILMEKSENEPDFFGKEAADGDEIDKISPSNNFAESWENTPDETIPSSANLENHAEIFAENPPAFTENQQTDDFPAENRTFAADTPDQPAAPTYFEETAAAAPEHDFEILETISGEHDAPHEKEEIEFSLDAEDSESFFIEEAEMSSLKEYSFLENRTENEFSENFLSEAPAAIDEILLEQKIAPETENRSDYDFSAVGESQNEVADLRDSEERAEVLPVYETAADENYFAAYHQPTAEFSADESSLKNSENFSPASFSEDFGIGDQTMNTTETIAFEEFTETEKAPVFAASAGEFFSDFSAPSETMIFEELAECSYCGFGNSPQTVVCADCRTILSLSDLEMLLAYQDADNLLLEKAIERIEARTTERDLTAAEFQTLGIAHLNAKNLRKGFNCLQEASKLTPNDVVLGSKVNFLAIRLSEIELQESKNQESFPVSRTIMVVDDSPTVRKLISGKLEKSGHFVVTAVDGIDAMTKIGEMIPDLILLDIAMPQMDGYQVCRLIRNNEATKDVPVVMISGKDGFFDKVRGKMVGSTGYITKPFGPETLMKAVENYIN